MGTPERAGVEWVPLVGTLLVGVPIAIVLVAAAWAGIRRRRARGTRKAAARGSRPKRVPRPERGGDGAAAPGFAAPLPRRQAAEGSRVPKTRK